MTIRATILDEIKAIAAEQQKALASLSDDVALMESGLDSLGFALLVARLEDALGVDPFVSLAGSQFPTTLGGLVSLYELAAA